MAIYTRILVAVDLAKDTQHIAKRARALAETFGADLAMVHVVEPLPIVTPLSPESATMPAMAETQQVVIEAAKQRLKDLAAKLGLRETAWSVELGMVKAEILRVARDRGADLIVLGSRERHGLSLLVDFTEDTVLHKAQCDVLAIRV